MHFFLSFMIAIWTRSIFEYFAFLKTRDGGNMKIFWYLFVTIKAIVKYFKLMMDYWNSSFCCVIFNSRLIKAVTFWFAANEFTWLTHRNDVRKNGKMRLKSTERRSIWVLRQYSRQIADNIENVLTSDNNTHQLQSTQPWKRKDLNWSCIGVLQLGCQVLLEEWRTILSGFHDFWLLGPWECSCFSMIRVSNITTSEVRTLSLSLNLYNTSSKITLWFSTNTLSSILHQITWKFNYDCWFPLYVWVLMVEN